MKKKISPWPYLKVYIMPFPKHNSNISAHQVILKSLKTNCPYSFRRNVVNFQLLHFGWVRLNMADLFLNFVRAKRIGNWALHLQSVAEMVSWYFACDHFELCQVSPGVYLWDACCSRFPSFGCKASCCWRSCSSATKSVLLQSDINGPDNWTNHELR